MFWTISSIPNLKILLAKFKAGIGCYTPRNILLAKPVKLYIFWVLQTCFSIDFSVTKFSKILKNLLKYKEKKCNTIILGHKNRSVNLKYTSIFIYYGSSI